MSHIYKYEIAATQTSELYLSGTATILDLQYQLCLWIVLEGNRDSLVIIRPYFTGSYINHEGTYLKTIQTLVTHYFYEVKV